MERSKRMRKATTQDIELLNRFGKTFASPGSKDRKTPHPKLEKATRVRLLRQFLMMNDDLLPRGTEGVLVFTLLSDSPANRRLK